MTKKTKTLVRYNTMTDNESVYFLRQAGLLSETAPSYRLVDLFCGAGGLTLGFSQFFGQIFVPVWANDFNMYAAKTYEKNFGCHCTTDDILEITERRINEIPKADVVIGGPPCQGFSQLGKRQKDDARNQLWRQYMKFVAHFTPKIFLIEKEADGRQVRRMVGRAQGRGCYAQTASTKA